MLHPTLGMSIGELEIKIDLRMGTRVTWGAGNAEPRNVHIGGLERRALLTIGPLDGCLRVQRSVRRGEDCLEISENVQTSK